MKSGLYACAGASATASAAACAKRFDEPITNESNVYFGLSPPATTSRGGGSGEALAASCSRSAIASCTLRSWPVASPTAARIRRSEEHTSELQSHSDLVCRLLLE